MNNLIKIINIFGVKVIYDKLDYCRDITLPIYFTPVDGKEKQEFEKIEDKYSFITTSAIHVIDLSVKDFVNIFKCDVTGVYEFTNNIIEPYCDGTIDKDIVYAIFVFLHEVGHYIQFEKLDRNVLDFMKKDYDLSKKNNDKMFYFYNKLQKCIDNGIECDLDPEEKKLLMNNMLEYRNIPKEKDADNFALSQMKSILELYKNSYLSE